MKKLINLIILVATLSPQSFAITRAPVDTSAGDMLRSTDENENDDAAAKWGTSGKEARAEKLETARPLAPIGESSFAHENNRAPASMRGPAMVKPAAKTKILPTAKTMIRTLKQKKAYQEMAVIVNDLGFFPSTLFVTQGVPVRLYVTGASQRSQCMIVDAFGIRRQVRSQKVEEVIFTPDQIGKFAFTCPMNGAKGTIIVKELEVDRMPASEQAEDQVQATAAPEAPAESLINDSDFGIEFRAKP